MKKTKLIVHQFTGENYRDVNFYIEQLEKEGYEFVSVQTAMAASGDNSLIGAQSTITVVMQNWQG